MLIAAGGSEGIGQIKPGLEAELSELAITYELLGVVGEDGGVENPSSVVGGGPIIAANLDTIGL